jgi:hypothetical protein
VIRIINTAVNRAHSSTLRLFVEPFALGAFVRGDIIDIIGNGRETLVHINLLAVFFNSALHGGSIAESPFGSAFINCIIRTFWFARPAVDTFFCDLDCHGYQVLIFSKIILIRTFEI